MSDATNEKFLESKNEAEQEAWWDWNQQCAGSIAQEYDLAVEAGLTDGGMDEDDHQLYIGSDKQWNYFEKLKKLRLNK